MNPQCRPDEPTRPSQLWNDITCMKVPTLGRYLGRYVKRMTLRLCEHKKNARTGRCYELKTQYASMCTKDPHLSSISLVPV